MVIYDCGIDQITLEKEGAIEYSIAYRGIKYK